MFVSLFWHFGWSFKGEAVGVYLEHRSPRNVTHGFLIHYIRASGDDARSSMTGSRHAVLIANRQFYYENLFMLEIVKRPKNRIKDSSVRRQVLNKYMHIIF